MALQAQLQLNPYGNFDPSQWSNPYSNYQSSALPAATYAGWPTDALGQPISALPGMTLNSSAPSPAAAPPPAASNAASPQMLALLQQMIPAMANPGTPIQSSRGQTLYSGGNQAQLTNLQNQLNQMSQAASAAPAATTPAPTSNAAGLTPQQYMQLRANPGHVATPGATVPESSSQPLGSGVLQQFLANWKPATSGPGSGFQQAFSAALGKG